VLDVMRESDGPIVAVRARGILTEDDYLNVLVPQVRRALGAGERIRVLLFMDETFRGWNARAAWRNTCLDLRHRRDFDKVAIVGVSAWEQWCATLVEGLITGEIRTFARDELSTAWTWLRD
jgi:hypothetical protein